MRLALVVTVAILPILGACAPAGDATSGGPVARQAGAPRACFQPQQVTNYRTTGDQTLYLRTFQGDVFEVSAGGCRDLQTGFGLTITPSIGINDRLCVGDGARIAVASPSSPQGPCMARIARSLTPAEIEALPDRDRP